MGKLSLSSSYHAKLCREIGVKVSYHLVMGPLDHLPQTSWELDTTMVTDFRALLSMISVFIMEATDVPEQGSRRLWLIDDNPEPPVALDVSLLCLQVVTLPDWLGALEMYSCARRCTWVQDAVPLLQPCFCLSPVCDPFSVDLFSGSGFYALWCASTTLLASTESPSPGPSAPFSVPLYSLIMEKATSGGGIRACGLFVNKSKDEVFVKSMVNPSSCVPPVLTVVSHLFPLSPSSHVLCPLLVSCPQLTCQFFKMRIIFPKYGTYSAWQKLENLWALL